MLALLSASHGFKIRLNNRNRNLFISHWGGTNLEVLMQNSLKNNLGQIHVMHSSWSVGMRKTTKRNALSQPPDAKSPFTQISY